MSSAPLVATSLTAFTVVALVAAIGLGMWFAYSGISLMNAEYHPHLAVIHRGNETIIVNPGSEPVPVIAAYCPHRGVYHIGTTIPPGGSMVVPAPNCYVITYGGKVIRRGSPTDLEVARMIIMMSRSGTSSVPAACRLSIETPHTIAAPVGGRACIAVAAVAYRPAIASAALVNGSRTIDEETEAIYGARTMPLCWGMERSGVFTYTMTVEASCGSSKATRTWVATVYGYVPWIRVCWYGSTAVVANMGSSSVSVWWSGTTTIIAPGRVVRVSPAPSAFTWVQPVDHTTLTLTTTPGW